MAKKKSTKKKTAKKAKSVKYKAPKQVENLVHEDAARRNIPTAELQSVMKGDDQRPVPVTYPRGGGDGGRRRTSSFGGWAVFRKSRPQPRPGPATGVARQRRAGPERPGGAGRAAVHSGEGAPQGAHRRPAAADRGGPEIAKKLASGEYQKPEDQLDLFADFNGLPEHGDARTEFYEHDQHWTNRMILGDSLSVMGSARRARGATREGAVHLF